MYCVSFPEFDFNSDIRKRIDLVSNTYPKAKFVAVEVAGKKGLKPLEILIGAKGLHMLMNSLDSPKDGIIFAAVGQKKQVVS